MSKSKKKPVKKKALPKKKYKTKKPGPIPFSFWFAYGFPKPGMTNPKKTQYEIEQGYKDYLADWDTTHPADPSHAIQFTWEKSTGHPKVYTLIAEIYPAPVPAPDPPPSGGTITPPAPPPPPPPSLS